MFIKKSPEWIVSSLPFDSNYELIRHLWYRTDLDPWKKDFLGSRDERRCALCDNPKATFTKESHLIPASLGNRTYYSLEECDKCNEDYADLHDDHLAKMLMPERLFAQIPMRKGYPIFKGRDNAKIQWKRNLEALMVDSELISEQSDKELIIKFELQAHNKLNALKSIMRSVWLAMESKERRRHIKLRNIITGRHAMVNTEYAWIVFQPGIHAVILDFWQKIDAGDSAEPDLIIRFCIGTAGIIWCMSKEDNLGTFPSMLPQFPDGIESHFAVKHISGNDTEIEIRNILFSHGGGLDLQEDDEKREDKNSLLLIPPQRKRDYPEEPVTICFKTSESAWNVDDLILRHCQTSDKVERYKIFGPGFAGELTLHHEVLDSRTSLLVNFEPEKHDLGQTKKSISLLRDIQSFSGIMEVYSLNTNELRFTCTQGEIPDKEQIKKDANMLLELIDALIVLTKHNPLLFLPQGRIQKEEYKAVLLLSKLSMRKTVIESGETVEVILPLRIIQALLKNYDVSGKINIIFDERPPFPLLGQEIHLGVGEYVKSEYFEIEFSDEVLAIGKQIHDQNGDRAMRISFRCSKIIHRIIRGSFNMDNIGGSSGEAKPRLRREP